MDCWAEEIPADIFSAMERNYQIRSYVRRAGRLTPAQHRALSELAPAYLINPSSFSPDPHILFGRVTPIILEIGFGNGESLVVQAKNRPDQDFIGIEVYRSGVGHLLQRCHTLQLTNIRIINADAMDILENSIPDDYLAGVQVFFPDPWPKRRHHKRRIIRPEFVALLARKLNIDGYLHLATDWQSYATQMIEVMEDSGVFYNTFSPGCFAPDPQGRSITRFEHRGRKLGYEVWDLIYRRKG